MVASVVSVTMETIVMLADNVCNTTEEACREAVQFK